MVGWQGWATKYVRSGRSGRWPAKGAGVEQHHHGAGAQLGRDLVGDLADEGVGDRQDHHVGRVDGGVGIHAAQAGLGLQAFPAGGAGLDVAHGEIGLQQVLRQAHAHLAAGAEQGNRRCHGCDVLGVVRPGPRALVNE